MEDNDAIPLVWGVWGASATVTGNACGPILVKAHPDEVYLDGKA
jgi:hypothetical protein